MATTASCLLLCSLQADHRHLIGRVSTRDLGFGSMCAMYHVGGLLEYSKRGKVQYRGVPLSVWKQYSHI